tara:strand:- start:60 stop:287 length:228 start_codon:yes stop_codon:yes gene_type:complete
MNNRRFIIRELVNLKDLREQDKKDKKREKKLIKENKNKPFIYKQNKILLNDRVRLTDIIRGSNRTKYLINNEFMP